MKAIASRKYVTDDFKEAGFEELFWSENAMVINICALKYANYVTYYNNELISDHDYYALIKYKMQFAKTIVIDSESRNIKIMNV